MFKVVFDLDGTLWRPHSVALPAFKETMRGLGLSIPSDEELLNTLGYPIDEIWQMLWPEGNIEDHQKATLVMDKAEEKYLREGNGELFPYVIETLQGLKDLGCELYVLSNCGVEYLHYVSSGLNIAELFAELHCAGMYPGQTKAEILKGLLQGDKNAVMVGDRHHDIEAGKVNNIPAIWCAFGFGNRGEIPATEFIAHEFPDILHIVTGIMREPSLP